jgi:hypothetical protein
VWDIKRKTLKNVIGIMPILIFREKKAPLIVRITMTKFAMIAIIDKTKVMTRHPLFLWKESTIFYSDLDIRIMLKRIISK